MLPSPYYLFKSPGTEVNGDYYEVSKKGWQIIEQAAVLSSLLPYFFFFLFGYSTLDSGGPISLTFIFQNYKFYVFYCRINHALSFFFRGRDLRLSLFSDFRL